MNTQALINGLISGAGVALLAAAFQLVYLPTRVFFVGLAGVYTVCPYVALSVLQAGGGWAGAIPATVLTSVALCLLCEGWNHARLSRKGASESAHLISSLGISVALVQCVAIVWGNEPKVLTTGAEPDSHLGDIRVTWTQWMMLSTAAGLLSAFALLLNRSGVGLRLRGMAENRTGFGFLGHDRDRHRRLAFALSGLFVAAASLVSAYDLGFDPQGGLHAVLLAVVAVIIGGRWSFAGPVAGALLLGVLRSLVVWHISARWQEAGTFALLAIFLLVRPQGLIGRRTRLEATS